MFSAALIHWAADAGAFWAQFAKTEVGKHGRESRKESMVAILA